MGVEMDQRSQRLEPEERRRAIMGSARRMIRESSYEQLRLERLLQEMNLSKGGFYHHFGSTHELLAALIREDVVGHLELIRSAEQKPSALKGLVAVLRVGSSYLSGDQGGLADINGAEGRREYLDILEKELDQPVSEVIRRNFERGVVQGEYRKHDSENLAYLFSAANAYGNRRSILGEWSDRQNIDFSQFSLSLLAEQLGVGDRLITLFENTR
jgi:AcrR family transcriptional regulator